MRTPFGIGGRSGVGGAFASRSEPGGAASPAFPPSEAERIEAAVRATACEAEWARAKGLSIASIRDIADRVVESLREEIGLERLPACTVWKILHEAALKPWHYRSWLFPKDPQFAERANVVLDLYAGLYEGEALSPRDVVLSLDEKPQLLLRTRCHPTVPPRPGRPGLVEFEYERHGTGVLLAGMDVRTGQVFHEVVETNGIVPFQAFLKRILDHGPYREAERIFLIVDNGSSHARTTFPGRLADQFPRSSHPELVAVSLPVHASWLNQIEIFFSIVQRKALKRFECSSREAMAEHLRRFIDSHNLHSHNLHPRPFRWSFTKRDLAERMKRWPQPLPTPI